MTERTTAVDHTPVDDIPANPDAASTPRPKVAEATDDGRPSVHALPSRLRLAGEAVAMAVAGYVLAWLYIPAIRDSSQSIFGDVTTNAMAPDRDGLAGWIRDGVFPLWARTTYGGEPYLANLQHGTAYPGSLLFLIGSSSTAQDIVIATHLALACVGMWAYLRLAVRTSGWAAVLGALCYTVGGVMLSHTVLADQFHVMCWMPLMFLTGHLALERRRLRWTVLTALTIGIAFLAGHPEPWLYQMAALAAYAVAWILFRGEEAGRLARRAWDAARYLGGAVVLFVLLFGWQLLPTLALKGQGYRTSPTFNQQYPLPEATGINALLPDFGRVLIGENQAFVGTAALCLVGLALVARRRGTLWLRVWLLVTATAGVIMALGLQNPIAAFLYHHSSLVKGFRVPSRYLLMTYFALCVGAALGLDELLYNAVGRWRARLRQGVLAVAVLAAGLGVMLVLADIRNDGASWKKWLAAAGIGGLVWLAAAFRRIPRTALALVLIGLTAGELYYARPYAEYRQKVPNEVYDSNGPTLAAIGAGGGRYITIAGPPATQAQKESIPIPADVADTTAKRNYYLAGVYPRLVGRPGIQVSEHAETILGRDGGLLPLRRYHDFYLAAVHAGGDINSGVTGTPPSQWSWTALDFLAIKWFVTRDDLPATERAVLGQHGFRVVGHDAYVLRWERAEPPLARLVHAVDVIPTDEARTAALAASYPLLARAIVEQPVDLDPAPATPTSPTSPTSPTTPTRQAGAESVRTVHVGNTSVELVATSVGRSLLVLADPYYPGWRVSVDGRPATVLPVDQAFRGVVLPAGEHTVTFSYVDGDFRLGLLLAALTGAGLVGMPLAAGVLRRRRNATADGPAEATEPGPGPRPEPEQTER